MAKRRCLQCGKIITGRIRKYDKSRGKYCSRECFYKSQRAKMETLKCDNCGKTFQREMWKVKAMPTKKHFCSRKCYLDYRKKGTGVYHRENATTWVAPELKGELLKKEYESGLRIREIATKYKVSYTIVNARMKKAGIKTDNQRYFTQNSYSAVRDKIKRERGDKCEICGWDKGSCDIHHRRQRVNGGNDDESNLIIVCPNCHRLIHENKLKV